MCFYTSITFWLCVTLAFAQPAAIPDPHEASWPHERNINVVSVRQPQGKLPTSSLHTPINPISSTTAVSSPLVTPEHRNHNVAVGFNGSSFTPTALKNVSTGDAITFYFYPHNFSIAQSSFSPPCTPITDHVSGQYSIFSGFDYDTTSGISLNKFIINITTTDPIWLYGFDGNAADGGSLCQRGMAMVINPLPKDRANGETLRAYVKSANAVALDIAGTTVEKVPGRVYGGEKVRLSERQKEHWEARHPQDRTLSNDDIGDYGSGIDTNSTTGTGKMGNAGATNGTQVAPFHSGAERGTSIKATFTGLAVLIVAAMFGLGM